MILKQLEQQQQQLTKALLDRVLSVLLAGMPSTPVMHIWNRRNKRGRSPYFNPVSNGAFHLTNILKISGTFGPKQNETVWSNRKFSCWTGLIGVALDKFPFPVPFCRKISRKFRPKLKRIGSVQPVWCNQRKNPGRFCSIRHMKFSNFWSNGLISPGPT